MSIDRKPARLNTAFTITLTAHCAGCHTRRESDRNGLGGVDAYADFHLQLLADGWIFDSSITYCSEQCEQDFHTRLGALGVAL